MHFSSYSGRLFIMTLSASTNVYWIRYWTALDFR